MEQLRFRLPCSDLVASRSKKSESGELYDCNFRIDFTAYYAPAPRVGDIKRR